jgi:hypothetical protein
VGCGPQAVVVEYRRWEADRRRRLWKSGFGMQVGEIDEDRVLRGGGRGEADRNSGRKKERTGGHGRLLGDAPGVASIEVLADWPGSLWGMCESAVGGRGTIVDWGSRRFWTPGR